MKQISFVESIRYRFHLAANQISHNLFFYMPIYFSLFINWTCSQIDEQCRPITCSVHVGLLPTRNTLRENIQKIGIWQFSLLYKKTNLKMQVTCEGDIRV